MNISGQWRRLAQGVLLIAAVGLASCGGGTSQETAFVPSRVIVLGDEASVLLPDGRKYGVNALADSGALDCSQQPIWVQTLMTAWNYTFAECDPGGNAELRKGVMRAQAGAKVDGLRQQLDAAIADGSLAGTLVVMMVGANDILELYGQYPARTEDSLITELRERGVLYAQQVNRAIDQGARVIVATVPDMGLTPYALAQKAAHADTDRAALLTRLTAAYNGRLRINIVNDGRLVGLVLADESTQVMARYPGSFAVRNAVDAACTVALPDCTTRTLVADATGSTHMWADATRMGYPLQLKIGQEALNRAVNNPF